MSSSCNDWQTTQLRTDSSKARTRYRQLRLNIWSRNRRDDHHTLESRIAWYPKLVKVACEEEIAHVIHLEDGHAQRWPTPRSYIIYSTGPRTRAFRRNRPSRYPFWKIQCSGDIERLLPRRFVCQSFPNFPSFFFFFLNSRVDSSCSLAEASLGDAHLEFVNSKLAETQQELQKKVDALESELKVSQNPEKMSVIQEMISVGNFY